METLGESLYSGGRDKLESIVDMSEGDGVVKLEGYSLGDSLVTDSKAEIGSSNGCSYGNVNGTRRGTDGEVMIYQNRIYTQVIRSDISQ